MNNKAAPYSSMDKHNVITLITGVISLLAYLYLSSHSQSYGDASLFNLLSVSGVCAGLCFVTWSYHWHTKQEVSVYLLLIFAVLFRLIGVASYPVLEDDGFRYLWDGYLSIEYGTPYDYVPADFFDNQYLPERFDDILGLINYPSIATIYGPLCQAVFSLSYLIAPGELWPLQAIFALADLGVILLLLKLARPLWVLLYAWSPLIIKEFAFTAHPDVLGVFFLLLAYTLFRSREFWWVGICVALAAGVKVFAIVLLPFLFQFNWRAWLGFCLMVLLLALPWGLTQAWLPEGLKAMSDDWVFNSLIYNILASWLTINTSKLILLAAYALVMGIYCYKYLFKNNLKQISFRPDLIFLGLFICTPALNAWYLVWLLPFAVIYPSLWAWVASVAILLAYVSGINLPGSNLAPYQVPNWALIIEFGLILIAGLIPFVAKARREVGNRDK